MIILLRSVYSDLLSGGLVWCENANRRRRIHRGRMIDTQCLLLLLLILTSSACCRGLEHYRLLEASRSGGGTALFSGIAHAWSHGLDHGILYHLFLFAFLGRLVLFVVSDGQKFYPVNNLLV